MVYSRCVATGLVRTWEMTRPESDPGRQAADRLGVTPQAISLRAQSAQLRLEAANIPPLVQALEALDAAAE